MHNGDIDEGGFKDRVDKVFGSISSSSSWSLPLLDAQLQRRSAPLHSHRDVDDDSNKSLHHHQEDHDDWGGIRSSIGLDSTLDHEEEEDAYDKMAQGTEEDCLYAPFFNSHNDSAASSLRQDTRIKSILKRKTKTCSIDEVPKSAKRRVRFHSTCKNPDQTPQVSQQNRPAGLPDYLLNPSKYTRYTFDDCSHDGEELLDPIKPKESSKHVVAAAAASELPKSLVFIPRKKRGEEHVRRQSSTQACSTIGIAALEEGEEMQQDNDDVSIKATCQKQRARRHYRSKKDDDDDDGS